MDQRVFSRPIYLEPWIKCDNFLPLNYPANHPDALAGHWEQVNFCHNAPNEHVLIRLSSGLRIYFLRLYA